MATEPDETQAGKAWKELTRSLGVYAPKKLNAARRSIRETHKLCNTGRKAR